MSTTNVTTAEPSARHNLSQFVRQQAREAVVDLGFGWFGTTNAPSTYPQLRAAFERSRQTGQPLPVSSEFCEDTVFESGADNIAYRFWHDVSHCRLGLSFQLADEWELALWHMTQIRAAGYDIGSAEYELLRIDLFGQIILSGLVGRFPFRQGSFARTCADVGLEAGVLAELRALP